MSVSSQLQRPHVSNSKRVSASGKRRSSVSKLTADGSLNVSKRNGRKKSVCRRSARKKR
jgi:hypothetical protein